MINERTLDLAKLAQSGNCLRIHDMNDAFAVDQPLMAGAPKRPADHRRELIR
jgi:hypothetical protein